MASNGSCFMATWIIFKNHLLEVGLTQNRETMALRNLIENSLKKYMVDGPITCDFTLHLRAYDHIPLFWNFVVGQPFDTSFGLTISWSRLLAHF